MKPLQLRAVLADNLRTHLRRRGWSVVAFADFAQVSKSQVYDVLAATRSAKIDFLAQLASALEVEPADLLRERPRRRER